jgi:4-hydroxybenzoate polyprenyltransferase
MNIARFSRLVMIEQSVFGLPWMFASALLGVQAHQTWQDAQRWTLWLWIVVAFTAARTAGMALNRLIDRQIDAANPRTSGRPLQKGEVTTRQVWLLAVASTLLFVIACACINSWCLMLSPIVLALVWGYSYTKRFTACSHFVLGSIHFFCPIFAWVAVTGVPDWPPVVLGVALWISIAGSDIIYALQDRLFDKGYGLHSVPVVLGPKLSLLLAKTLHGIAIVLLIAMGWFLGLSTPFFVGMGLTAVCFAYLHFLTTTETQQINKLFFYYNTIVAVLFLASVVGAMAWHA